MKLTHIGFPEIQLSINMVSESKKNNLSPVAVYTYTRVEHFIKTIESLKSNHLAKSTTLYVISDGPKYEHHKNFVESIRNYTEDISGFREVVKIFRPNNLGMAVNLPDAEQQILSDHGKIINMEDDNISSKNYLDFINAGLDYFEDDESVYSVCGYCPPVAPVTVSSYGDFWYYPWNITWGYGIWKTKHDHLSRLPNLYPEYRRTGLLTRQNRAGGLYVTDSLKRHYEGLKYFPDAVLCTEMFAKNMRSIIPTVSKIRNIGQDGSGQSSYKITDKYDVELDDGVLRGFDFSHESMHADYFRNNARNFFNGGAVTRLARKFGIYHHLTAWRNYLINGR